MIFHLYFALLMILSRGDATLVRNLIKDREATVRQLTIQSRTESMVSYDKFKEGLDIDALQDELKKSCNCRLQHLASLGAFILHYDSADHLSASSFLNIPNISHATEDKVEILEFQDNLRPEQRSVPDDPRFSEQWALQKLDNDADINWQEGIEAYKSDPQGGSPDGPSVILAVIDTGIDYNHPDLKDVMWTNPGEIPDNNIDDDGNGIVDDVYGVDYTSDDRGNPIDRQSHGTHCAGIIAAQANNTEGIAGVAGVSQGKVKLMAVKGLSDSGAGRLSWLMAGLDYAIANGAKISSNSWGGGSDSGVLADILKNNPDHLFVAAAGNDGRQITEENPLTTCSTNAANQLCVGSTGENDERSPFSNWGKPYVHVMAPGAKILSTIPGERFASYSGTSMACPQVSGLAALMTTMRSGLSAIQLKELIEGNVQKKSQYEEFVTTGGLIDVYKTITAVSNLDSGNSTEPPIEFLCAKLNEAYLPNKNSSRTLNVYDAAKYDYEATIAPATWDNVVSSVEVQPGCVLSGYEDTEQNQLMFTLAEGSYELPKKESLSSWICLCEPKALEPKKVYVERACENSELVLECSSGKIEVQYASYGRTSKALCKKGRKRTRRNTKCYSEQPTTMNYIKEQCNDKSSCVLGANNGVFGDPCRGTTKYLEVHFNC